MSDLDLIIFGPQSDLPNLEYVDGLRTALLSTPNLQTFIDTIQSLPKIWASLTEYDVNLRLVHVDAVFEELQAWIKDGRPFATADKKLNILTMPFTIIVQVIQYMAYLQGEKSTGHQRMLDRLRLGGVQGFCAGFLTAIAISCAKDEREVCVLASVALRLALCVGAYVDLQEIQGKEFVSLAVRWKSDAVREKLTGILQEHPDAFISIIRDSTDANITVPRKDTASLMAKIRAQGMVVKETGLPGLYHSSENQRLYQLLIEFTQSRNDLQFPSSMALRTPLISNLDSRVIESGSLVEHALRCILVDTADWLSLTSTAVENLRDEAIVLVFGTIDSIPASLERERELKVIKARSLNLQTFQDEKYPEHAIAVVGMACKFPGADSTIEFWDLLLSGKSMAEKMPRQRFSTERLRRTQDSKRNVAFWGNFIDDVDAFDHRFFGKSSREAASMDPQQRILLQVAYDALASSGYFGMSSTRSSKNIGCFLGVCSSDYNDNVASNPPNAYSTTGTLRAFLSGKISHFFGWTGPSITYDTACSSSAVAIHAACRAVNGGECSQALAGGVSVYTSPYFYQNLATGSFLSPTGPTKSFDANADGYCRGEGAGLVLLKHLDMAIADGDEILGVIAGSAVNQNCNVNPITVPYGPSQIALYNEVCRLSKISPRDVSYIEAHGTGTPVGDPIEMESIRHVFGHAHRRGLVHIASVKGNIGHLESASGVAALIKTLLMMQYSTIPSQPNFKTLNPKISSLEPDHISIPVTNQQWKTKFKAACINNYGAAGSNAAMMIFQAPQNTSNLERRQHSLSSPSLQKYPIFLSAASSESLRQYCYVLQKHLMESMAVMDKGNLLPTIAFNLALKQDASLKFTLVSSVASAEELEKMLRLEASEISIIERPTLKPVILCFGGQVNSFIGLNKAIYEEVALLRSHLDHCDSIICSQGLPSIYPGIFKEENVQDVVQLHCMLFSLQYACARTWIESGLHIDAVVGHSFGQLTALTVSGVLSLEDGLRLVSGRALLIKSRWGPERGTMISIEADLTAIYNILSQIPGQSIEIACYNGYASHVLVGTKADMNAFEDILLDQAPITRIRWKKLNVTHGFHSIFTEPLLSELYQAAQGLHFRDPTIALETCSKDETWQKTTAQSVVDHTRTPVFFGEAIVRLAERFGSCTWIEAGSNSSIVGMVRRALPAKDVATHNFQALQLNTSNSLNYLSDLTVKLWTDGYRCQFWPFLNGKNGRYRMINMPPYQFEKTRHWLDWKENAVSEILSKSVDDSDKNQLLRFISQDVDGRVQFIINTESEEFQLLVGGHRVLGHPLCPASLYVELFARAFTSFKALSASTMEYINIEDLEIKAPLGLKQSRTVMLFMRVPDSAEQPWSFEVLSVSSANGKGNEDSSSHARGKLITSSFSSNSDFARCKRLVNHQRVDDMLIDPEVEALQGSMVYKAFSSVVSYAAYYKGVKAACAKDQESAGRVVLPNPIERSLQVAITRPLAVDNFMQVAGIHANLLNDCEEGELFVCTQVDRILPSSNFYRLDASVQDWAVYSCYSLAGERDLLNDIFVFDSLTKSLELALLGVHFTKVVSASLRKVLARVNEPIYTAETSTSDVHTTMAISEKLQTTLEQPVSEPTILEIERQDFPGNPDIGLEVRQLLSKVTDIPVNAIKQSSTLEELGIDSLMITEVHSEICEFFQLDIPGSDFQALEDIQAIQRYLVSKSSGRKSNTPENYSSTTMVSDNLSKDSLLHVEESFTGSTFPEASAFSSEAAILVHAQRAFNEIRLDYEGFAIDTGFSGFWRRVYPDQSRLVLSYVVESFLKMGCDIATLQVGESLPEISYNPKHKLLIKQMKKILVDGSLVRKDGERLVRTESPVEKASSLIIFEQVLRDFPQHASEHKLLNVTGSRLAECLTGKEDPLRLLFSDRGNKDLLRDVYANGPMYKAATKLLAGFLAKAYTTEKADEQFHVLEIGGGTGGTTEYLMDHLTNLERPFTYTFTDISQSLVSAAKKRFAKYKNMIFLTLDVEQAAPEQFHGYFHTVISANCVHATRDLTNSLKNIKQMLRADGFVSLVEFTLNLYWFDLVFGLLDGWWLFQDGREHVLANEWLWDENMKKAGFKHVSWTDGISQEAKTLRVITGFPAEAESDDFKPKLAPLKAETEIETVLIKRIGSCSLYADIYLPSEPLQGQIPIALLVHGGGHVMFTRRNINIPQTKILLSKGFLPVAIDYRFCPELAILNGPMGDCCEAFQWAREQLPKIRLEKAPYLKIDGNRIAVVGWSTGGHLAMSVGFTSISRGLQPPEAILAFYPPTDYEDECELDQTYIPSNLALEISKPDEEYDLLEGVQEEPISSYFPQSNKNFPGGMMTVQDPRWRFVLHMNWKAQMVPVLIQGLPSYSSLKASGRSAKEYENLPQPSSQEIIPISPHAQILRGNYRSPTFFVHGTADDLIPLTQSERAYEALKDSGIKTGIYRLEGADHLFDFFQDRSVGKKGPIAVEAGYQFLAETV